MSIGIFFRVVKKVILEKYVTEYYSLSLQIDFLDMSITTAGVCSVLCPSYAAVSCGMVRGRAEGKSKSEAEEDDRCVLGGGTTVVSRRTVRRGGRTEGRRRRRISHGETQSGATHPYGRRHTSVTGDGRPRLHLERMRSSIVISLRTPMTRAPSSLRRA
jgi:hypothetical protein